MQNFKSEGLNLNLRCIDTLIKSTVSNLNGTENDLSDLPIYTIHVYSKLGIYFSMIEYLKDYKIINSKYNPKISDFKSYCINKEHKDLALLTNLDNYIQEILEPIILDTDLLNAYSEIFEDENRFIFYGTEDIEDTQILRRADNELDFNLLGIDSALTKVEQKFANKETIIEDAVNEVKHYPKDKYKAIFCDEQYNPSEYIKEAKDYFNEILDSIIALFQNIDKMENYIQFFTDILLEELIILNQRLTMNRVVAKYEIENKKKTTKNYFAELVGKGTTYNDYGYKSNYPVPVLVKLSTFLDTTPSNLLYSQSIEDYIKETYGLNKSSLATLKTLNKNSPHIINEINKTLKEQSK